MCTLFFSTSQENVEFSLNLENKSWLLLRLLLLITLQYFLGVPLLKCHSMQIDSQFLNHWLFHWLLNLFIDFLKVHLVKKKNKKGPYPLFWSSNMSSCLEEDKLFWNNIKCQICTWENKYSKQHFEWAKRVCYPLDRWQVG